MKMPDQSPQQELLQWSFEDIFTSEDCDAIVKAYSSEMLKKEPPFIGNVDGQIDLNVRNVQRVIIPIYKELGAQLAAAGLSANNQAWKFDITHANQAEFLIYSSGGHYSAHIDTFMVLYPQRLWKILSTSKQRHCLGVSKLLLAWRGTRGRRNTLFSGLLDGW
jgi:hypothetical protein